MLNSATREGCRSICTTSKIRRAVSSSLIYFAILAFCAFFAAGPSWGQASVLTQHNDAGRTGQNINETILNTSNVTVNQFGKLFALPVTGQVYAQPLYVPGVTIGGVVHNVVIVATEADMVYAFDADSNTGANATPLWMASLVDAAHGARPNEGPLTENLTIGCTDMQPQIGITSTPVIDPTTHTIYVEAKSVVSTNVTYIHRLHALSIINGAEVAPGPVVITATVPGTGDGSKSGSLTFDPLHQLNRPGLLELIGGSFSTIYVAFASHCDYGPYHGWIFAYDTATFAQKSLMITDPNGGLGGFWMAGSGVAADETSNIFIASGNGDFNMGTTPVEYGDSIIKLGTTNEILSTLDYFTPSDQSCLDGSDEDLGSGGLLILPDQPGTFKHILVQAGKEGKIYVVNRDMMTTSNGHYNNLPNCQSSDPEIIEESASGAIGGMWAMPAYWNNTLYFWGAGDVLKSIPITSGLPDFTHITPNSTNIGFPGTTPSISSNGTTSGTAILWASDNSKYGSPGPAHAPAVLHAFDATAIGSELWNSTQACNNRDEAGNAVKFTVPTIANGKVYLGTSTEVDVYGLLANGSCTQPPATPVISPASETFSSPLHVSITDSTTGASIYYTTNNTPPTTSSTKYAHPFPISTTSTVQAIASANGLTSAIASTTYTFSPAVAAPTFSPAPGTYSGSVTVTISDNTSGALIYYTTDGTRPQVGQGTTQQYTTPLTFTARSTSLRAIAVNGAQSSALAAGAYHIK